MTAATKTERLDLRVPAATKRTIEQAAALNGESVSHFVLAAAARAARKVIEQSEVIALSAQGRDRLLAALDSPAPPNAALRRAADRHDAMIG